MSIQDRTREFIGKVKLATGKAFHNRRLRIEGRSDELQGRAGMMASKLRGLDKHDQPMR